jgi:O-antigen ligase
MEARLGRIAVASNPLYVPAVLFFALVLLQVVLKTTAYRHATVQELLLYVSYGLLAFVADQTLRGPRERRLFLLVMGIFGAAYALFAIVQSFTSAGRIFWFWTPSVSTGVYGSYVDHNHYAGLMEMLWPTLAVLAFADSGRGGKRGLLLLGAALMAGSIPLSLSRGGMIAMGVQGLFLCVVFRRNRLRKLIYGTVAALAVAGVVLLAGSSAVFSRLDSLSHPLQSEVGGARLAVTADTLRMFRDRPLLGFGLDTFSSVYPRYQSFTSSVFMNAAHNDFAQLLSETGIVGFGLMVWFLVLVYRRGLRNLYRSGELQAATLVSLTGVTGLLAHSFFDFNLHLPANAALFYVLCWTAVAEPALRSRVRLHGVATEAMEK